MYFKIFLTFKEAQFEVRQLISSLFPGAETGVCYFRSSIVRSMHKMSSSSLFRYLPLFLISVTLSCQPQAEKAPVKTPGWERLGPGGGGSTFKPTFSYHSDSEFILRCDMTGAYLTRDGGQSFSQINFPNGSSSFAYDPHDSLKIYIGSQTLHRSTDGGKNWQMIFPPEGSDFSRDFMP